MLSQKIIITMIVIERTTFEHKEHIDINLSTIHIYWIVAKNNNDSQNQKIINKRNRTLLRYCHKPIVLYI